MNDEMTLPKRRMGTSHWDKKLVANMLALSNADNYEDAHKEWIATGDVWWRGNGDVPPWIQANNHPNFCLCGHGIVYHFRIQNTENGNEEIVGSDHINSYLIIRAIERETGMAAEQITEELIQKWLNVRVKGMKAESWWKANGDAFESMFNTVKEADLRYNTRIAEYRYSSQTEGTEPVYNLIKKKSAGEEMASIVWRWNHPENSRAQINSRGYPNDALMHDLSMFYVKCLTGLNERLQAEKAAREARIAERAKLRRFRHEEQERAREENRRKAEEKRKEREAYDKKMAPIWEAQQAERRKRRLAVAAEEKLEVSLHLKAHGSKADSMLEFYGLEPRDWELVDYMTTNQMKAIRRYIGASKLKDLSGEAVRQIDLYFNEALEKKNGEEK